MERTEQENVNNWILHYLEGTALQEELSSLNNWIRTSDENRKYYLQIKNIWEVSGKNASSVKISADEAFDHVLNRIAEKTGNERTLLSYIQRIAAILIIPTILGSYFIGKHLQNKNTMPSVAYNEIYASFGTRSTVVLSDGSKVWLNSGSRLRYPDKFVSGKREVFLTGEGFFEVHSDVTRPFIVNTRSLNVQATGTRFNVQAFQSEPAVHVSLVSGKVSVNKNMDKNGRQTLAHLVPNQMFSYDTLTGRTQTFTGDIYQYIAWKDGRLVFRNVPLSEVVKKISQIYNVEIELQGKELQGYRYRATFEEESLNEILKLLQLSSPVKCRETKRSLLPNGMFTKRKIIISPL